MTSDTLGHENIKYSMIPLEDKGSMSGIEVVGLLASASQLVIYSFKITTSLSEICRRVQDAPLVVKQRSDQVKQLISTAEFIKQNHHLHTAHVLIHLNETLEQAKTLSTTLEQLTNDYSRGSIRRCWKILIATKEKAILANFDRLEKEKSALVLSISVAQTGLLERGIRILGMAEEEAPKHSVLMKDEDTAIEDGDSVSLPHWISCWHDTHG